MFAPSRIGGVISLYALRMLFPSDDGGLLDTGGLGFYDQFVLFRRVPTLRCSR